MYYLKYRPQTFSELFGLEEVAASLQKALAKGQTAHAYIFTGPKGSGKTTLARILAKALNCERLSASKVQPASPAGGRSTLAAEEIEPCNKCSACEAINNGSYLDLIEIDAASNRGIDDIRELRDRIKLAPSHARIKVYIIDEVHMLTREAFNALLKTLEEPPSHAIFILATTEFHKIPETIRSRCQVLKFPRAGRADIVKKLSLICEKEKVKVKPEKLLLIAEMAEGGFRNAETLLEQVVVGELELHSTGPTPARLLGFLVDNKTSEVLEEINKFWEKGGNLHELSRQIVVFLRQMLLIKGGVSAPQLDLEKETADQILSLNQKLKINDVVFLLEKFLSVFEIDRYSPLPQLALEIAAVEAGRYLADEVEQTAGGGDIGEGSAEKEESGQAATAESPKIKPRNPLKVSLEEIETRWSDFLKAVKPLNHSLEALLRSAKPKELSPGGFLTIEVFYKFHKEKLSEARNRSLVEEALAKVFNGQTEVNFVLGQKSDQSPSPAGTLKSPPADEDKNLVEAALEAFGS